MRLFTADEWQTHILHARNDAAIYHRLANRYPEVADELNTLARHAEEREYVIISATERMKNRLQERERKMRVHGWLMNVVVLLALLLVAATVVHVQPAIAQDVPPTAEFSPAGELMQIDGQGGGEVPAENPRSWVSLESLMPYLITMFIISLGAVVALGFGGFVLLYRSIPPALQPIFKAMGDAFLTELERRAASTKETIDDESVARLGKEWKEATATPVLTEANKAA